MPGQAIIPGDFTINMVTDTRMPRTRTVRIEVVAQDQRVRVDLTADEFVSAMSGLHLVDIPIMVTVGPADVAERCDVFISDGLEGSGIGWPCARPKGHPDDGPMPGIRGGHSRHPLPQDG